MLALLRFRFVTTRGSLAYLSFAACTTPAPPAHTSVLLLLPIHTSSPSHRWLDSLPLLAASPLPLSPPAFAQSADGGTSTSTSTSDPEGHNEERIGCGQEGNLLRTHVSNQPPRDIENMNPADGLEGAYRETWKHMRSPDLDCGPSALVVSAGLTADKRSSIFSLSWLDGACTLTSSYITPRYYERSKSIALG